MTLYKVYLIILGAFSSEWHCLSYPLLLCVPFRNGLKFTSSITCPIKIISFHNCEHFLHISILNEVLEIQNVILNIIWIIKMFALTNYITLP